MLEMVFAIDPCPIEAALGCTTCIDRCLGPHDTIMIKFLSNLIMMMFTCHFLVKDDLQQLI